MNEVKLTSYCTAEVSNRYNVCAQLINNVVNNVKTKFTDTYNYRLGVFRLEN